MELVADSNGSVCLVHHPLALVDKLALFKPVNTHVVWRSFSPLKNHFFLPVWTGLVSGDLTLKKSDFFRAELDQILFIVISITHQT